jgi:predicted nucleic acid-binding OB-fold protein
MNPTPAFDAHIPVLTEVLHDNPAAPQLEHSAQLEQRAVDGWSEREWELMERRLSERILLQLQNKVDFVLEQRLKDSMAEVLQHALSGLTHEIRNGLQQTIEKIVARAVAQELAHLQTLKK